MAVSQSIRFLALIVVAFASCLCVFAQGPPGIESTEVDRTGKGSIRGRVIMPDGSFVMDSVRITLQTLRGNVLTIYTENQGQFEFPELVPAMYNVEVEADRQKFEVVSETIQVYRGMPSVLTITLKPKKSASPAARDDHSVSVTELTQKIPSKAQKEFEKATQAGNAGQTDEAILHLRKAISIFPDYVRARNDLGTYLLGQGKLDEAAAELRKAVSVDDNSFYPTLNLGIVLVHARQLKEAATILNKAVTLEPNSPSAQLYLGLALYGLGNLDASEAALKTAYSLGGAKFGAALYHLGQICLGRGESASALKYFETYLTVVPDARNADQVRNLIVTLRP